MKNWVRNLKIRSKLNLMILTSLIGLILLGGISVTIIKSTKIVNIMLLAQRNYMMEYHGSLENLYRIFET